MKVFSCKKELIEHLTCVHSNLACPVCKQQVSDLSTLILHLQYQCINDSEVIFVVIVLSRQEPLVSDFIYTLLIM